MTENRYGAAWAKNRSLKASVKDAWFLFALHLKKEFRAFAPFVLLVAMLAAFFVEMCRQYMADACIPVVRMMQAGVPEEFIVQQCWGGVWLLVGGIVSALLLLLVSYWYFGRVFRFLKAVASGSGMDAVLRHSVLVREDRSLARRLLSVDLASVLLCSIVSIIVGALAWHWPGVALLMIPFLVYIMVAARAARHEYVFEEKGYRTSLKLGYGKKWGKSFILDMVCMWPVLAVRLIALLPMVVGFYATYMATDSFLMGDNVQMSGVLPVLLFVLNTLGFAVYGVSGLFMVYARSMRLHQVSTSVRKA